MSVDSDNEDIFFEEESENQINEEKETSCQATEDIDSFGSQSSTEGQQKGPHKFKGPVTKAFKRVFRSRSSSPRVNNVNVSRRDSPNRSEGSSDSASLAALSTESKPESSTSSTALLSEYGTYSDHEDDEDFENSERTLVPSSTTETLTRKSMTQLPCKQQENLEVKPMVTSRSFSCLQSSFFRSNPKHEQTSFGKRKGDEIFKSSRFKSRLKKSSLSKSSSSKDLPKVFISIDDDYPRTPEEDKVFSTTLISENDDEIYEIMSINENDGLVTPDKVFFSDKGSEEDLSDKEKPIGPQKVTNILKSLSSRVNKSTSEYHEIKPSSQESEAMTSSLNEENISSGNSIDLPNPSDKVTFDSKRKMLRKFALSLQKDKNKLGPEVKPVEEELPTRNLLNDHNSSEESLPSIPDRNLRKGKFRELSSFLIRENNVSSLKKLSDENDCEDPLGEPCVAGPGPGAKNLKSFGEKVAEYLQRGGSRLQEQQRRLKSQIWSSVVTIVLVEGKNLPPVGQGGVVDPYVKFRLGNEKYKSKVELRTLNPRWLEQFDFHLFEDQSQLLEISVWDKDPRSKDDFIGKCTLDLREYERENTQEVWAELEGDVDLGAGHNGKLFLLLTISGTTSSASISDLITYKENPNEIRTISERYNLLRSFHNLRDVGLLTVKVFKAQGLAAADFGVGKSDPFCVLELVNSRLQTQTEYKTLCPSWNKIFTFDVKDIHSVLEVTVYDEDRDHKVDFLGKIAIPLLRIRNGEKKWYALKDKKLRIRAKGNHPEILMECSVYWNPVRAAIQTIEPKEDKYMQIEPKFKKQIFVRNVNRIKTAIMDIYDFGLYIKSCFEWESPFRSIVAFILFMVVTYYFEAYMIPAFILLLFLKNYIVISIVGSRYPKDDDAESSANEDEMDEDDKDKEEKKSLKERLQAIQEVIATVQNAIGYIASICESIKNTFNFTVPFLSWLMVVALLMVMAILYFIPIRFLVLLWGINKFSRKLIRPHSVVNNEIIDFLSRVPDDEELKDYRELRPNLHSTEDRKKEGKKKKVV